VIISIFWHFQYVQVDKNDSTRPTIQTEQNVIITGIKEYEESSVDTGIATMAGMYGFGVNRYHHETGNRIVEIGARMACFRNESNHHELSLDVRTADGKLHRGLTLTEHTIKLNENYEFKTMTKKSIVVQAERKQLPPNYASMATTTLIKTIQQYMDAIQIETDENSGGGGHRSLHNAKEFAKYFPGIVDGERVDIGQVSMFLLDAVSQLAKFMILNIPHTNQTTSSNQF
jgi:hypothetical protein